MRTWFPPRQFTPSPTTTPGGVFVVAWKYRTVEVGGMPVPLRTMVSPRMLATPAADRCAPAGTNEFEQPLPGAPLAHGQAVPVPSPKHSPVTTAGSGFFLTWIPLMLTKLRATVATTE